MVVRMCDDPDCVQLVHMADVPVKHGRTNRCRSRGKCGAWPSRGGCVLPAGHNEGRADIPTAHRFPGSTVSVAIVDGVGRDVEDVTNENGATQSKIPYALSTAPIRAILSVGAVQAEGDAKRGVHNWHGISVEDHINHALTHLLSYLVGDRQDDHLQHAAWRALAAHEVELIEKEKRGE